MSTRKTLGNLPSGPTMNDVAEEAGISWISVSRAINSPEKVSEKMRRKVDQAIKKLNYHPNVAAQTLATGSSKVIAAIVPTMANALYAHTVQGLMDVLAPKGFQILLGNSAYSEIEEESLVQTFFGWRPDGLILTSPVHTDSLRQRLTKIDIPVIETWSLPDNPIDMAIGYSDREAARVLAEHLESRGHKSFCYITRPLDEFFFAKARWEAFKQAVSHIGEPVLIQREGVANSGIEAVREMLAISGLPDAIVCGSSLFAVGALMELAAQGIDVPGRTAVAGIGNVELAPHLSPSLTAVSTEPYLIGQKAGEMMLAAMRGEIPPNKSLNVGVKLIIRGST